VEQSETRKRRSRSRSWSPVDHRECASETSSRRKKPLWSKTEKKQALRSQVAELRQLEVELEQYKRRASSFTPGSESSSVESYSTQHGREQIINKYHKQIVSNIDYTLSQMKAPAE